VTVRKLPRLPLESLAPYLLEFQRPFVAAPLASDDASVAGRIACYDGKKPLDFHEVFGNDSAVELEIGFGKGLFLLNASEKAPDTNFLGIEKERPYTLFTATRLAKRARKNVRVVSADARDFVKEWVADGAIQTAHIYFPDPWWKKRHHKRRLFNEDFAGQLVRVLRLGGRLSFATDVPEYYAETMPMLRAIPVLAELPAPDETDARHDMDYLTNFERKFRKQAKPIFRSLLEKRDQESIT